MQEAFRKPIHEFAKWFEYVPQFKDPEADELHLDLISVATAQKMVRISMLYSLKTAFTLS